MPNPDERKNKRPTESLYTANELRYQTIDHYKRSPYYKRLLHKPEKSQPNARMKNFSENAHCSADFYRIFHKENKRGASIKPLIDSPLVYFLYRRKPKR